MILGTAGINEAYRTGRGKIRVRAVTDIEPMDNGKTVLLSPNFRIWSTKPD